MSSNPYSVTRKVQPVASAFLRNVPKAPQIYAQKPTWTPSGITMTVPRSSPSSSGGPTTAPGADTFAQQETLPPATMPQGTGTGWSMDGLLSASQFAAPGADMTGGQIPGAIKVGNAGPGAAYEQAAPGWSTGAKVAAGVAVLALVGGGGYLVWRRTAKKRGG